MGKIQFICTLIAVNALLTLKAVSNPQINSISSILDHPVQGKEVILRGQVIDQQPGERDYLFTDGTNEITIELKDNNFSYNPDTTVEILGIVDLETQNPEEVAQDPTPEEIQIQVNQLRVLTTDN